MLKKINVGVIIKLWESWMVGQVIVGLLARCEYIRLITWYWKYRENSAKILVEIIIIII